MGGIVRGRMGMDSPICDASIFDARGRWMMDCQLAEPVPFIRLPVALPVQVTLLRHPSGDDLPPILVAQRLLDSEVWSGERRCLYVDVECRAIPSPGELLCRRAAAALTTGLRHMAGTTDEVERDWLDFRTAPFYTGRQIRTTLAMPAGPDHLREFPVYVEDTPAGWAEHWRAAKELLRFRPQRIP